MKLLNFKKSKNASIGIELEYQIIDPLTFDMKSRAKELMRMIMTSPFHKIIKPEVTQSMIEFNTTIHHSPSVMYRELLEMQKFLIKAGNELKVYFCGGGTHPFQKWSARKIFPSPRYKHLANQYRYLSKRSTVFGFHVHIGCERGDDAIYLTHALTRYAPQLIALSASSPFYQGVDTGYMCSRPNAFNAFPTSGVMPFLKNWQEFSAYFYKMRNLKIIKTMKDVYWDIRPKPEFGTVEVRVCDTPLTIKKAIQLTAYLQSLAHYLLTEKPFQLTPDIYFVYPYNHFQAMRYGYDGHFINPINLKNLLLGEDIIDTFKKIEPHAEKLKNAELLAQLKRDVVRKQNDATQLRKIFAKCGSLSKVVEQQCLIWSKDDDNFLKL